MAEATVLTSGQRIAIALAYGGACLAVGLGAPAHPLSGIPGSPWDPVPAMGFVLVARRGLGWVPLTLAGAVLADLASGRLLAVPGLSLVSAAGESLAAATIAMVLQGKSTPPLGLDRMQGLLRVFAGFILASFGVGAVTAAMVSVSGRPAPEAALQNALRDGMSFMVAMTMVAPALLIHFPFRRPARWPDPTVETVLQVVALAVIGWEVLGRFANAEIHFFYLLFLPVAWITTRHGQKGGSLALVSIFITTLISDRIVVHHDQAIIELQIRLLALAATGLLLGMTVSERQADELRMQSRHSELARLQRLAIGHEMASALAHELNQPLTAAMNYTQAALRLLRGPAPDTERIAEVMHKSVNRIERAGHIVSGLREFMRKGDLHPTRTAVEDIVEDALHLVSAESADAGIAVRTFLGAGLPPLLVDKTQLVQVLVNLLRNAIQSVAVSGRAAGTVTVSCHVREGQVEIAVVDDGQGIAPEIMSRLFEPFVTTKASGMGLGLSISKSILEYHGGRLWGENAPAGGAAFHVSLPVVGEEADG